MSIYYVIGTEREDLCDSGSAIKKLILDKRIEGLSVFGIADLKPLADQGYLYTDPDCNAKSARVYIYYSNYFRKLIATTRADGYQCNNLLSLPIYYPSSNNGGTAYFSKCELR